MNRNKKRINFAIVSIAIINVLQFLPLSQLTANPISERYIYTRTQPTQHITNAALLQENETLLENK